MLKFLCTVALFLVTVQSIQETSSSSMTIPYPFFGSRTAYNAVSPGKIEIEPVYTPRQMIMMARHGLRTSKIQIPRDELPKLYEFQTKITENATLCENHIQAIKNWVTNLDSTQHRKLTQKGKNEMKELATRVRDAFPNLFQLPYSSGNYEVWTMPDSRCFQSAQSFIYTFFKGENITEIPKCDINDILLAIDTMMEVDPKFVESRKAYLEDLKEFEQSVHMAGVVQNVAAKLGIDPKELNPKIVTTMYEVSAYEYANDETAVPPWYNVFTQDDLEVLEFAWDIPWSNVIGHGNPHNPKLACPIAIRLEERLRKKINGEGPDAVFYFACEKNLIIMLFILGIGKDDPPFTASNYKGMKDLQWRTSFYGPWAGNYIAVLLEDAQNNYFVEIFFNEKPLEITLNDGSSCTICRWLDFQAKIQAFIRDNDCYNFAAAVTLQNYKDSSLYWYVSTTKPAYQMDSTEEIIVNDHSTPIQIFTVNSLVTSALTRNFINKLLPLLENLKGKITRLDDCQAINTWEENIKSKLNEKVSIRKGHDELKELALKIKKAFPKLFEKPDKYKATVIGGEHCKETGIAFLQTVYDDKKITDVPKSSDDELFLMAEKFKKQKYEKEKEPESIEFKNSQLVNKVVERVRVKMGNDGITLDEVMIMFEVCNHDTSIDDEVTSFWCNVFSQKDSEILEYVDDLRLYNTYGYGKKSNLKHACPMAITLLTTLGGKINKIGEQPDCVFNFAERSSILGLHVMLGLGQDGNPLKSSNFDDMKNRQWRSSAFGSWSANFMAVLLENANDDYRVAFYHNEHIASIPLGNGTSCTECPWTDIKNKIIAFLSCNDCASFVAAIVLQNYKDSSLYWYSGTIPAYKSDSGEGLIVVNNENIPIQIFTVNSNGTEYLKQSFTSKLFYLLESLKEKITGNDETALSSPKRLKLNTDKVSIQNGHEETKQWAIVIRKAFPKLFENSNNFKAMAIGRECTESDLAFLQTVYDDTNITEVPECNDDDLFSMVEKNKKQKYEKEKAPESTEFKKSDSMKNVVERVKSKTGNDAITLDEVLIMFEGCRYDTIINDGLTSLWCNVFSQEDLEVLEYVDDLRSYYTYGYGNVSSLKLACPMATTLLSTLEGKINNKEEGPDGVFHFADRSYILSLHVVLGLLKDDSPLKSSNFNDMKNRQWRSSAFGRRSGNFTAVLYQYPDGHKVAFYFNDTIASIPLENDLPCNVCLWSDIKNKIKAFIGDNECDKYIADILPADKMKIA